MGRRKKAAKKSVKKAKKVVATVFKCLYCNHDDAVSCKMDDSAMTGTLKCRICGCSYTTSINSLSEPIDVYSEWLDETDERQREGLSLREHDGDDDERRVRRRIE
jgi:transcription elongation factor Elf1